MTKVEALAIVVAMAMELEDRDPAEQRALLTWAHHVDKVRNRHSITNPNFDAEADRDPDRVGLKVVSQLAIFAGCTKSSCRVCAKTRSILAGTYES